MSSLLSLHLYLTMGSAFELGARLSDALFAENENFDINNGGVVEAFNTASVFRISQQDIDMFCTRQQQPYNLLQKQMNYLDEFGVFVDKLRGTAERQTLVQNLQISTDLKALHEKQMNYNKDFRTFIEQLPLLQTQVSDFTRFIDKLRTRAAIEEIGEEMGEEIGKLDLNEEVKEEMDANVSRSAKKGRIRRLKRERLRREREEAGDLSPRPAILQNRSPMMRMTRRLKKEREKEKRLRFWIYVTTSFFFIIYIPLLIYIITRILTP